MLFFFGFFSEEKAIFSKKNKNLSFFLWSSLRVTSPIDGKSMAGVPSIRVHRGPDYKNYNHSIRRTEVFMLQVNTK